MKTKKSTIKTIIGCTTACSALMLAGFGAMNLNSPKYETYATGVDSIPVSISNANFNSNTSSSYPYSPNNYTAYINGNKVSSSNNEESNVSAGVINLSNEKFESRFALAKRSSIDDYVLMIDSTDEDDRTAMHTVDYGFQTSSSIKLDANSKYMFTVDVFNATNINSAQLYLFDSNGEVFSSIKNINSYNSWTTYTFFVATNNTESLELKLGMYLQGTGTVLFDNISGFKLSDNEYNFTKNSSILGTFVEENKNDNIERTYYINNAGEIEYKDNSTPVTSNLSHVEYEFGKNSTTTISNDSDGQNSKSILIENVDKTFSQYETDEIFTFEQNRVYKVSVNVKTRDLDGTASLQLIRTDIDEDDENYDSSLNKTIKITSNTVSSNDSVTYDYTTYSFLINSHPSKELKFKLKFGLGLTDALTSGKMYVSEIEVSKINYETFNSASTGSGTEKINFVDAYSNSKIMLNNGDFNAFKIEDYNSPIPATPIDWEVSTGSNNQKYGVVNTLTFEEDLKDYNLSNLTNPLKEQNNNILMMYNETADSLSYKSSTKKLSSLTYHKFEIDVFTQNAPLNVALVSTKNDNEVVIASKTVNTKQTWQTVSLFVHVGYEDLDVALKLSLITEDYGYAYVDNAKFDYLLTTSELETEFKSASNSDLSAVIDLTDMLSSSSTEKFASSKLFTTTENTGVESGTITFKSNYLDEVIDVDEEKSPNNLDIFNQIAGDLIDKKALSIWSTDEVYHTLTSKFGYALSGSDKFYKLTVDVFTQNIDSNTETNKDLLGAQIKLSGFENSFKNIKSNNAWTTYTLYFKVDASTTTYLELSLGSEEAKTKGAVFFTNITFDNTITQAEYENVRENSTTKVLKVASTSETESEETNKTQEEKQKNKTNWFILIPSLLTVLAIVIAFVGIAMRKIKWKNPFKKKSKTAYDRNKTVSVQYYARKATTLREEKVRELNADWKKINEERKQYEEDYKRDLTKLREMKIKRANPAEIVKLEKELKKNQKISSNLGLTANKIIEELKYVKTDMYLNSLMKKLAREQTNQNNSKESEDNKED